MNEEWISVSGFSKYLVSNAGRFKNKKTEKIMKQTIVNGYYMVGLVPDVSIGGLNTKLLSHRVIALAWLPYSYRPGLVVNHRNNIRLDNRLDNLEWITQSQNVKLCIRRAQS